MPASPVDRVAVADERQLKGLLLGYRILGESGHTIANHNSTNL